MLFLMICQIYACADYEPDVAELHSSDLLHVVDYLRASHRYYMESLLPSIAKGVERVLEGCDAKQSAILRKFYDDYAEEVRAHLNYEETTIFPHVKSILEGVPSDSRMAEFMAHHTDICDKVDDIKSIVIKYLPEVCSTRQRCDLLFDIFALREELLKHTMLEMRLLAPVVINAENKKQ